MHPISAAIVAEMIVVIAILIGAAIITNMGAIGAAVERLGWFQ